MRCILIYNPASGSNRHGRAEQMRHVAEALADLGHHVELTATTAPGSATIQAREAVGTGAEIVFACGGDGTVHEVLQGLVSDSGEPTCSLGIIPLGSANALARHMRLSLDPVEAALEEVHGKAQTISIGKLEYSGTVRYFTVMAGAGPDGALVYNLLTAEKSKLGRLAYYLQAARLFATRRFAPFEVEYTEANSAAASTQLAVCAMAVRVGDLGGLFGKLASHRASMHHAHLQLILLRPPAMLSLPLWFASGWLNLHGLNPFLSFVEVTEFSCRPRSGPAVYFEADGEWLGRIPMQVSLIPNALRLLVPCKEDR